MIEDIIWQQNITEDIKKHIANSQLILWDLDGTLYESGPGIYNGIRYAINALGLKQPDEQVLNSMIGPPLRDSFQKNFGLTSEEANIAVKHYRIYYVQKGLYEGKIYPDIAEVLANLKKQGKVLTVATSKPWIFAHRVLSRYKLRSYFDTVFGSYRDGRLDTKSEVIESVIKHYQGNQPLGKGRLLGKAIQSTSKNDLQPLMIGDRFYDVQGALDYNIKTIGVSYGYGTTEELLNSGAVAVVHQPTQVLKLFS